MLNVIEHLAFLALVVLVHWHTLASIRVLQRQIDQLKDQIRNK